MNKLAVINKQYLLLGGTCLLLIIGYEIAFKNTLNSWKLNQKLQQQLTQANDISAEPGYLSRKNKNLDQIIRSYQLDSLVFRNNVMNKIADLAEPLGIKLITIPSDDVVYHTPQFIVQKLDFEGDFFSLLKLVNKIQTTAEIGILRSVSWKAKKTPLQNLSTPKLDLEIYMEMYR